jgi:predicted ATPase/DNA-binding CsgD family transcriptional regulator
VERTTAGRLLLDEAVPLLTLTGPGGVGKTRLAVAIANDVSNHFADGVAFVDLSTLQDSSLILGAVGRAVGLTGETADPKQQLLAVLRPRQLLLMLDNCEHLIEAVAELTSDLLAECPALQVLATSRAPLRLLGEHTFPVPPLPLPPATDSLSADRAAMSPAVRLFVSRAQGARPDFELTDANTRAVDMICRHLDGLPLAIELAAARVRHLMPAELAGQLLAPEGGSALRVLNAGPRDAPGRQRALRFAIAWSYNLLAPQEQTLFRRLAVFVGGLTLEAAQAVAHTDGNAAIDAVEGIAALVDQSLLLQQESIPGESRYGMLETVREFALEQLVASGEDVAVRDAQAAYFLRFAERASPLLSGEHQQAWLERLQAEHANLRVVLGRLEQTGEVERALRLAAALWRFWYRRGYWLEGRGWLVRLLTLAEAGGDVEATTRAMALTGAGWLAHYFRELGQDDFAAAQAALAEGHARYRRLGRTDGLIDVLEGQSWVALSLGENRRAANLCEEALALSRSLGDHVRTADSLCNLSRATRDLGEYARARTLAQEALVLYQAVGHQGGRAMALLVLGDVARDLGETAEVRARCEESLVIFRALCEPLAEGFSLHNLAVAAFGDGNLARARALCEESLAIFQRLDVRGATAEVLASLGPILDAARDPESALAALTEALQQAWRVGPRWVVAASLEGIANVVARQEEELVAVELASGAAALRAQIEVPTPPNWRAALDQTLARARETLGQAAFDAAWEQGQARPLPDLIASTAQFEIVLPAPATRAAEVKDSARSTGLSPRELEVLRLLVAGKTDREIADALFISRRTASKHVGSILAKLDVTSRAEAAILTVQRSLV